MQKGLDLSSLWRKPLDLKYVTYSAEPYLLMSVETELPTKTITTNKLMKISSKMQTCIKHARGFRCSAKESAVRMQVYKLLICHTPISIIPIELEQETESVTPMGEPDKPYILYSYLMNLIQRFLVEVINEQKTLL